MLCGQFIHHQQHVLQCQRVVVVDINKKGSIGTGSRKRVTKVDVVDHQ